MSRIFTNCRRALAALCLIASPLSGTAQTTSAKFDAGRQTHTEQELREFLKPIPPRSAEEARAALQVVDGFEMQLVAAEPMVNDPIAAAFDEDGNLYVCEMRDYPFRPKAGKPALGRIRLLKDTNRDGQFDVSHIFAEDLLWVSGVAPWKGGVFATAAPDIWYLKDTNGDGTADVRRKAFTGFGDKKSQSIFNNLKWGLDHRIYGASSGNGGSVIPIGQPNAKPIEFRRQDFRFHPETLALEIVPGRSQFGNTFNDWGQRFLCSQANAVFDIAWNDSAPPDAILSPPDPTHNPLIGPTPIFRISPIERWRAIRSQRRIVSGERKATSTGASHHVLDGVAGSTVYRGDAFPSEFRGNLFVGGAQNNLIHRRSLEPNGVTFKSQRLDENEEFARSPDNWFRPVNFVNAPDGTLYSIDLAREILEAVHIPFDVANVLDLTRGRDRGRVFRIAPEGFKTRSVPKMSDATSMELVKLLGHANAWHHETAHRLLFERQDKSIVSKLRSILTDSARISEESARRRLNALWSLDGLDSLTDNDLIQALITPHAAIRENALRIARSREPLSKSVLDAVISLTDDNNPRVRLHCAFALGSQNTGPATDALARMARRDTGDRWIRAAVLSAPRRHAPGMTKRLLQDSTFSSFSSSSLVLAPLTEAIGARNKATELAEISQTIVNLKSDSLQEILFLSLDKGLRRAGTSLPKIDLARAADLRLATMRENAGQRLKSKPEYSSANLRAIRLAAMNDTPVARERLMAVFGPTVDSRIQVASVRALLQFTGGGIERELLKICAFSARAARREIIEGMASRKNGVPALLDAIEAGAIAPFEIPGIHRKRLLKHNSPDVSRRAIKLFARPGAQSLAEIFDSYKKSLDLAGNENSGQKSYQTLCMTCHRLNNEGKEVGPNLAFLKNRTPEEILSQIVDPNREVDPAYLQYTITRKNGETATGIIKSENAASITLLRTDAEETVSREDIGSIQASGLSLMPEGLHQALDVQGMADLLAYLRSSQYDLGTESDGFSPAR
ncbi:MAG: putative membrane-bound dehydrogenase-like protein [Candidatus Binatia bacterium]|jgi:putative membrane-bound dehydrogenase-like protein